MDSNFEFCGAAFHCISLIHSPLRQQGNEKVLVCPKPFVPLRKEPHPDAETFEEIVDFLVQTNVFTSKGEARKMLQGNGVSINKDKVTDQKVINSDDLLKGKYILVQKGKKNYYLITLE